MKNIVVIFGGKSTEHDISIISAFQVMQNLNRKKYNIIPVYISKNSKWFYGKKLFSLNSFKNFSTKGLSEVSILPNSNFLFKKSIAGYIKFKKIDVVIPVLHGMNGEDGTIQGLLELSNIPYSSCGVLSSSIGMDKVVMKKFFESIDIPICEYQTILKYELPDFKESDLLIDFPIIIKPANLGSSIGISMCNNFNELLEGLKVAFSFDNKVVIEKAIVNLKEINISVVGYKNQIEVSVTEEPKSWHEFLNFEDKYISNATKNSSKSGATSSKGMATNKRIIPARISKKNIQLIENYSRRIFKKLDCKGVIRIDFMYDKLYKKLYCNEINTIPGSFAFYLWQENGVSFTHLLDKLVEIAIKSNEDKKFLCYDFESKVL